MPLSNLVISSAYSVASQVNVLFWEVDMNLTKKTDSYEIFRTTTPGSYGITPYAVRAPQLDTQGINRSQDYALRYYEDTGVTGGVTYYYKVRLKDFEGNFGAFSPEVAVLCTGAKYYVDGTSGNNANNGSSGSPWQSIAHAVSNIPKNASHALVIKAASTYNLSVTYNMNGIAGLLGENNPTVNNIFGYNTGWWDNERPLFQWDNANANAYVSGIRFTTSRTSNRGWAPLLFKRTNGWIVKSNYCDNHFRGAVMAQSFGKNIAICYNDYRNNGQEEQGYSTGNWSMKGSFTNVFIHHNQVEYLLNGYGAKIWYSYEVPFDTLRNALICFNTFNGKTGSNFAPEYNIAHECFSMRQDGVVKSNNVFDMHTSDDTMTPSVTGPFSYYHHHNLYRIKRGQRWEDASSHTLSEDNIFDNTINANGWGGIGEFNNGGTMTNKTYRRDVHYGGVGALWVWTCNVQNVLIEYCTFIGDTTLFEFRRANSNGAKPGFRLRYNVFDGNIRMVFKTEGADGSIPQLIATEGNIFKSTPTYNGMSPFSATIATPQLQRSGAVPDPFYRHTPGGNAADKGAFQTTIAPPPVTNQNPQVSFVAPTPASGTQIQLGQSIPVVFSASDSDGTIAERKVIVNGVEQVIAGNSYTLTPPTIGNYSYAVQVTDNQGASTITPARTLSVIAVPVTPPPTPQPGAKVRSKNLNLTKIDKRWIQTLQGVV